MSKKKMCENVNRNFTKRRALQIADQESARRARQGADIRLWVTISALVVTEVVVIWAIARWLISGL
ncbi:MAG: hypothetical protein CMP98_15760 [Gammaproteobacteria bacterium]|nr:hypothetical protein [Gammaproteobacteria bacterium]